jgi:hypothetical protein
MCMHKFQSRQSHWNCARNKLLIAHETFSARLQEHHFSTGIEQRNCHTEPSCTLLKYSCSPVLYNFQSPHCNLEIKGVLDSRAFCARPETTQKGKAKWQAALMQPAEEVGPARCITAIDPRGYRRALELHGLAFHLNLK